jgi:hypothetical protein
LAGWNQAVAIAANKHRTFAPANIDERGTSHHTIRKEKKHRSESPDFHGKAKSIDPACTADRSHSFKLSGIANRIPAIGAARIGAYIIARVGNLVSAVTAAAVENGRVHVAY